MNIKSKLIEQLAVLENLQLLATNSDQLNLAFNISNGILQYTKEIASIDDDDDYICPSCEEAIVKEMLHQEIADSCDMPIEVVRRVLVGQDLVLSPPSKL